MASTAQTTLVVDIANKTLRFSARMAFRELAAVSVAGAADLPGNPATWGLYIRWRGADMASCVGFSAAGAGVLDLDTAALAAAFEGKAARRRLPFDVELWDNAARVLLGASQLRIQNNEAPDPATVSPQTNATYPAAAALAAHVVLRVRADGAVAVLDPTSGTDADSAVGLAAAAVAVPGGLVTVLREGPVFDSGWDWTAGHPVYAAADGALTQVVPVAGCCLRVGVATSACSLLLAMGEPLYL